MAEQPVTAPRSTAEKRAWRSYLLDTKDLRYEQYREVEPWAWDKLQAQLKLLRK